MKVLQINATYGYSSTGIIVKSIMDLCSENGIDSYVAFSNGLGQPEENMYEIGSFADHKIHALLCRIEGKQAYFSKKSTRQLIGYIEKIKPDIVHLHNLHNNYICLNMLLEYLARMDIATVITMHDCWYFTGGCFHYTSINCKKWMFGCGKCPKRLDDTPAYLYDASRSIMSDRVKYLSAIPRLKIVGCSEWIASECRKSLLSDIDIRCLHNGFDLNVFKPTQSNWRKKLNISDDKFVILAPATKWLSEANKCALDYFISNLSPDMVLILFGTSNYKGLMSEKVKVIGHISSPKVMAQVYSMADVMANCSKEDTLSSINIEAQACGTPVVAYDATGNKETIDLRSGFAVPVCNYIELFDKVNKVKAIGKNRLSEACVEFVESNFNSRTNYYKYINLYNEIIYGKAHTC